MSGFHTKGHTHSTYASVLMLHEAVPDEVWINPIDASVRQLKSGDMVHVFNDRGVVEIPCKWWQCRKARGPDWTATVWTWVDVLTH